MNERITENIFRNFILKDNFCLENKVVVEEQSSKDIKIDKLLKNASKSGNGKGYPEFIIQFKENADFIIVVECKANSKFHQSENKNKYKDFAVDGVLLYSSFLSKEYDVLSIAISGEENNLRISHFLQLKGTNEAHPMTNFNEDKFLSLEDYLNGYKKDERKFSQDFHELLKYSKNLNDKLHTLKVPESNRSLLISGCLIALSDKAFSSSYKFQKPKELAESLVNTIKNKLNDVQNKHIDDIITTYNFVKTHTILSNQENELRDIILEVDEKINNFIKNYKYFDTLGQFYIEFLRYANNDKGLGIVLTPPHITELFCDIANVNKDSIVLDTCTGTGGFLISAMKKMIIDAGGDKKKELEIKSKQIIGIEFQHEIFSLLCSNMYIHGDGRSNLIKGSCFDEKIIEQIKEFRPNVGFLNPPYKSGKDDIEELEFIFNNLSFLEKGSYCIAIVPMSCTLSNKKINLGLKEKLLRNHTLEAVFSMPNELFNNSEVGMGTCIMVFKAKEKHPENYKTYFGYWKDDGFSKRKNSGRGDYENKWENIKRYWLENYKNKEEIPCHSVKKFVSAKDEWCVESYMETDYSNLEKFYFIKSLKTFLSFKILNDNENVFEIRSKNLAGSIFNFNTDNWKEFLYEDIFNVERGKRSAEKSLENGEYPLIGASQNYNGSNRKFIDEYDFDGIYITVGNGGNTGCGQTFLQNGKFATISTVNVLSLKNKELNNFIGIFLITLIKLEKYRYNFGRGWSKEKMEKSIIKLPVDKKGNPDWEFMENYIKSLPYSSSLL